MQEGAEVHDQAYEDALRSGIDALESHVHAVQDQLNKSHKGVEEKLPQPESDLTAVREDLEKARKEKGRLQTELIATRDELETARWELEKARSKTTEPNSNYSTLQKTRNVMIDPKNVATVLLPLLRHINPIVRRAAVEAATDLGSPLLAFSLIQRLDDPDEDVRYAALIAVRLITKQSVPDQLPEDDSSRRTLVRSLRKQWIQEGGLGLRLEH